MPTNLERSRQAGIAIIFKYIELANVIRIPTDKAIRMDDDVTSHFAHSCNVREKMNPFLQLPQSGPFAPYEHISLLLLQVSLGSMIAPYLSSGVQQDPLTVLAIASFSLTVILALLLSPVQVPRRQRYIMVAY